MTTTIKKLENDLKIALKNQMNVCLVGKHGVGKTAVIKKVFDDAGFNWQYFSASTMDPFVDFIGCPKEKEVDGKMVLDLVRPKQFAFDEVEAIFLDEFNRAPKKVRNAVMELLQFKSINGQKFNNLKVIWTAINPPEDNYDVDELDPAQFDRFHLQLEVPYKPDATYFTQKFGKEVSSSAIEWWKSLPREQKDKVSPRRLDYALEAFNVGLDLNTVLSEDCNTNALYMKIKEGPVLTKLKSLRSDKTKKEFFANQNNWLSTKDVIKKSNEMTKKYVKFWPEEQIANEMVSDDDFFPNIISQIWDEEGAAIKSIVKEIYESKLNPKFNKKIDEADIAEMITSDLSDLG